MHLVHYSNNTSSIGIAHLPAGQFQPVTEFTLVMVYSSGKKLKWIIVF